MRLHFAILIYCGFPTCMLTFKQIRPLFHQLERQVICPGNTLYVLDTKRWLTPNSEESLVSESSIKIDQAGSVKDNDSKEAYILTALLFLVTSLCSLDRVAMSVAIIPMSTELHYSEAIKGAISSMFSFGYMFGLIPAGILSTFASPKYVLAIGVLLWSFAQAVSPAAAYYSLPALYACRFCMGLSEAVTTPTVQNFVARWIPDKDRALALSIILAGFQIGSVFAYVISPLLLDRFEWSGLFVAYGLIGIVWLLLWLPIARDSPSIVAVEHDISDIDATIVLSPNSQTDLKSESTSISEAMSTIPWKEIITSKEIQSIAIAHSVQNFGLYINLAWLPTYFNQIFGLSVVDSSLSSVLPWVAGGIVGPLTGLASNKLIASGVEVTTVRKVAQSIALVVPALTLLKLSVAEDLTSFEAMLYFILAVASAACNAAGFSASVQDVCKSPKYISVVYGVTSAPAVLVGSVGTYLTGLVLESTESWSLVFQGTALVYLAGALFYGVNYKARKIFE